MERPQVETDWERSCFSSYFSNEDIKIEPTLLKF